MELVDQIFQKHFGKAKLPGNKTLQLPPPCFVEMQGNMIEFVQGKSLKATFPVLQKQTNPAGFMQGGFIAAAFDNVFGPLSFLVAKKPTATIDMAVQYIRSVEADQEITVTARVVARGFSTLNMSGDLINSQGKLCATATTNLVIFRIPEKEDPQD